MNRYINDSIFSVDNFFKDDRWLYKIRINDYQLITILWNLSLILIPFGISWFLFRYWRKTGFNGIGRKLLVAILWFCWFLFIPNTAYIISEVRHLINFCPVNSPFQICEQNAWVVLFFFCYAAIGWASFVLLLNQMKRLVNEIAGELASLIYVIVTIPLIALGFLMGLIHRWNSWEFFIYPADFFNNLKLYWLDAAHFTNWLIFTIFLYVLYIGGYYLFKNKE